MRIWIRSPIRILGNHKHQLERQRGAGAAAGSWSSSGELEQQQGAGAEPEERSMDPARVGVGDERSRRRRHGRRRRCGAHLSARCYDIYNKLILVQNFRNKSMGYIVKTSFTSIKAAAPRDAGGGAAAPLAPPPVLLLPHPPISLKGHHRKSLHFQHEKVEIKFGQHLPSSLAISTLFWQGFAANSE